MKRIINNQKKYLIALAMVYVLASGCASSNSYLANRGRDAADIFTATVGSGIGGIKAHAGPVQTGLLFEGICVNFYGLYECDTQTKGLRGGEWLTEDTPKREFARWDTNCDYQYFIYGLEMFRGGETGASRGKSRAALTTALLTFPLPEDLFYKSKAAKEIDHEPAKFSPLPYFFDIEVALGIGYVYRFGFNIAEFFDFFFGIATVDFLDDDIGVINSNTQE